MIRQASLLLLILAAGAGVALFQVSYDVSALEDRLTTLNRNIVADQEALHVLRAEWSFLNQPARLEELSQRYLDLQPLNGAQIGDVAMLPVRLHPPVPAAPDTDHPGDAAGATALAALNQDVAGPQPIQKPRPPAPDMAHTDARIAVPVDDTSAPRPASPLAPGGGAIPVAARSLDDVLADLTRDGGRR